MQIIHVEYLMINQDHDLVYFLQDQNEMPIKMNHHAKQVITNNLTRAMVGVWATFTLEGGQKCTVLLQCILKYLLSIVEYILK